MTHQRKKEKDIALSLANFDCAILKYLIHFLFFSLHNIEQKYLVCHCIIIDIFIHFTTPVIPKLFFYLRLGCEFQGNMEVMLLILIWRKQCFETRHSTGIYNNNVLECNIYFIFFRFYT